LPLGLVPGNFAPVFAFACATLRLRSDHLELPSAHRLPLAWLLEAASPAIQYRAYAEVVPAPARDPAQLEALRLAALAYKPALAIARKQKDTGLWGANLLAPAPLKALGAAETGLVYQYRHLIELGWPGDQRPFRLADRLLFRLLSRDEDPALLVEFQRPAKSDPQLALWARSMGRQAASAALARAGNHSEDPRLRGAGHRIVSDISQYLRSDLAAKPFRKARGKTVLEPAAYPPTIFAVEMLAFLPALQRERAGFVERLGIYFSSPAPRRAFFILAGTKLLKPMFELLGDPLRADPQGRVTDVPFTLYWLELLARLGLVRQVPSANRTLARLFNECDDQGIWSPKNLRAMPRSANPLVAHYFPLEGPGKSPAQRQTDVTFRLALIAQIMGLPIEVA
jgi:hypothetical protein